jgi:hypothetical protein
MDPENSVVTDPTEDFTAMFEASIKARRFKEGQTLKGMIVAIGPEVAFIDVGGKEEATIEIDERDAPFLVMIGVHQRVVSRPGTALRLSALIHGCASQANSAKPVAAPSRGLRDDRS